MSRTYCWVFAGIGLLSSLNGCAPAPMPSNAPAAKDSEAVIPVAEDEIKISELMESTDGASGTSKDGFATVAPGHKVAVVEASDAATFGTSESEIHIAQMGKHGVDRNVLDTVKHFAVESDGDHLIWIIAPEFIDSLTDRESFIAEMKTIVVASGDRVTHVAVIPSATSKHQTFIKQVRDLGLKVYSAAEDGACFVEVHRPDGIVVGMPGKEYTD